MQQALRPGCKVSCRTSNRAAVSACMSGLAQPESTVLKPRQSGDCALRFGESYACASCYGWLADVDSIAFCSHAHVSCCRLCGSKARELVCFPRRSKLLEQFDVDLTGDATANEKAERRARPSFNFSLKKFAATA